MTQFICLVAAVIIHAFHAIPAKAQADTVFVFWSVDCPVCKSMVPYVNDLVHRFGADVSYMIVVPEELWDSASVDSFRKDYHLAVPFVMDTASRLQKRFSATTMPEAFVVRQSRVVYHGRINNLYYAIGRRRKSPTVHDLQVAIEQMITTKLVSPTYQPPIGCLLNHH